MILLYLATYLGVSVDLILKAGNPNVDFERKVEFNVLDVPKGFEAIETVKIGKETRTITRTNREQTLEELIKLRNKYKFRAIPIREDEIEERIIETEKIINPNF